MEIYSNSYLNTPEKLLKYMSKFQYGYRNKDKDVFTSEKDLENMYINNYRIQTPEEVLDSNVGVCWDQVAFEAYVFDKYIKLPYSIYYIEQKNPMCCTHTFLVYQKNNKYYYFENSYAKYRGIHKFNTEKECIEYVINNMRKDYKDNGVIYGKIDKIPSGLSTIEFMNYCNDQINGDYQVENELSQFIENSKIMNESKLSSKDRNNLEDNIFGLPEDRKYPLNDREHVIQAIRMFNNVESSKEKELAKNIIKRMKELDIDITIGDKNRLHKYYYNKESLNEFSLFNDKSIMVLSNKKISKVEEKDFGTVKPFLNHAICLYLKYHTSTKCKVKGEDGEDKTVYINKNDEKDFLAEKIYIYKFNKRDFSKGYNYYEAKKDLKCEEPEVISMKDFLSKHGWKIKYYSKDSKNIIPTAKKIISEKINKLKCKKGFSLSIDKDEEKEFNNGESDSISIYNWNLWKYNSNAREFFGTDECQDMYTDIQKAIKDANKELPKGYKFTFGNGDWDEDFIDLEKKFLIVLYINMKN